MAARANRLGVKRAEMEAYAATAFADLPAEERLAAIESAYSHVEEHAAETSPEEKEMIVNFNRVIKRGWEHFDNAVINALRLLDKLHVQKVSLAGFDGFKHKYNESYADAALPTLNPDNKWDELNEEINDMFQNFKASSNMKIAFLTESIFDHGEQTI